MKKNYPIRYAVMALYEPTRLVYENKRFEKEYNVVAHIVSKCFVIQTIENNFENGTKKVQHRVVFPYQRANSECDIWEISEPRFNSYKQCTNSVTVDKVFDNYQDALEDASRKNDEILSRNISYLSNQTTEEVKKVELEHEQRIKKYKVLEKEIRKNTIDLKIKQNIKEQSIIINLDDQVKTFSMSIYDFIKKFSNDEFCVYSVSEEEYEDIKNKIKADSEFIPKVSTSPLLISEFKDPVVKIIKPNSQNESHYYIKDEKLFHSNEKIECTSLPKTIVYTTENYTDIINSYTLSSEKNHKQSKNKCLVLK